MGSLSTFAPTIAQRRKALGLSQAQLAQAAATSLRTINALENGRAHEIGFHKLTRILAALGLELRLQEANNQRPTLEDLRNESADD